MIDPLLTKESLEILSQFEHLIVGFSGGLDSTVLLHALAFSPELFQKLQVVHIHHGLSPFANAWTSHCENICSAYSLKLKTYHVSFQSRANLEEEARKARLKIFTPLLDKNSCLILAHHADDQAETVLMNLCRGTGVDGLAAMPVMKPLGLGALYRPFLHLPRARLEAYAKQLHLQWIEDESNQDIVFSRNYLRHEIIPKLQERWPRAVHSINNCAINAQKAKSNLDDLAYIDCPDLIEDKDFLKLTPLLHLKEARVINVLRVWLNQQGVHSPSTQFFQNLINEVIKAAPDSNPKITCGESEIRRYRQCLYFIAQPSLSFDLLDKIEWAAFPDLLECHHTKWVALPATKGLHVAVGQSVEIRKRLGGEAIKLKGKTRTLKKLFQTWGIPPWLRDEIPLIYINDKLAAVLDFCIADPYYEEHGERIFSIKRKFITHEQDPS